MKTEEKTRRKKTFEPFYSDILELSQKKQISLNEARRELIKKESKKKQKK
ncbi:MAG: hypothetical protein ABFS12_12735 [Bacteroidota bacterium]